MKHINKIYNNLQWSITMLMALILVLGCSDDLDFLTAGTDETEYITFTATVDNSTVGVVTRSIGTNINSEEEDWLFATNDKKEDRTTRGVPVTSVAESVGLFGYISEDDSDAEIWSEMENRKFVLNGDELKAESNPISWKEVGATKNLRVYAYSPYSDDVSINTTGEIPTLDVTVSDNVTKQADIILADTLITPENQNKKIPLTFRHIMTAVRFKMHFACNVVSISVNNVKNSATYNFDKGWGTVTGNSNYTISFGDDGKYVAKDSLVTDGNNTLMMIPQLLPDNAEVVLTYKEGGEIKKISASLKGKEWKEGKMVTYTLHDKALHNFVYLDLAAGDVTITASGYTGYYYENGSSTSTKLTGTHDIKNVYHIYQSTEANRSTTGKIGGEWKLPQYPEVTYKGKSWSEFITNNDNVEEVIEVWDNGVNVKGSAATNEGFTDVAVVRDAGRSNTNYHIHVGGNVGSVDLVIENIYSTYHQRTGDINRERSRGGISFIPTDNSTLTINYIGDNRLGCIHYENNDSINNCLVFQGTGSLTVADADFFKYTEYGVTGYYANRACAAIGSKDQQDGKEGFDHAYNMVFNSGTLFAGATKAEFCTAIGGGGNGNSNITINGGSITAVASGTGTAIGGGTGLSYAGGIGNVTINNGNVYAYNHANIINIPTSAIGGAGSREKEGSAGNVNIKGGYVYAYSALGTAIGGGSSAKKKGGDANIKINNGYVIAISDVSIGIGGGSACTNGATTGKYNGGTAVVEITGNSIVRTGSIGGGLTDCDNGKIGSADINVVGGDIQAQFILAAGSTGTPTFFMNGGIIRNSDVNDETYVHVRNNGGAVYLEDGKFTMKGGIIENCNAEKGGAVYIVGNNNPTFEMSGGAIRDCIAKSDTTSADGGAVYLEGGTVTINGNANITGNISNGGNGGGICVKQGHFIMEDGEISGNNAVINNGRGGNGAGVYITSTNTANVELKSGSIKNNTAGRNGGGVCVEMQDDEKDATVNIGVDDGNVTESPYIQNNHSLTQGGGLYVLGKKSVINIYDGNITGNSTSSYVVNEDVANERGTVTLKSGNVTHVEVIFNLNGGFINDSAVNPVQNIVTATNSLLVLPPVNPSRPGYDFVKWDTDKNGNSGKSYTNETIMNIENSVTLYAVWKEQGQ